MVSFLHSTSVFHALGDETRSDIVSRLAAGQPMRVSDIAASYTVTRPAISKHLKVLEQAEIIRMEWRGREKLCHFRPESLRAAKDWIVRNEQMWADALGNLSDYFENLNMPSDEEKDR
ncbi:MAG: ArsR/SmtB family transcription factor [Hoeflea sp.]|uniref:ArsR/SmtB family transcription factor n=1 Tax=Hoeflea sp. TaxID=1940281 RepID=UPI003EF170F5